MSKLDRFALKNLVLKICILFTIGAHSLEVKTIDAKLENVYKFEIVRGQRHIFVYDSIQENIRDYRKRSRLDDTRKFIKTLKIVASADHQYDPECPLLVMASEKKTVQFWEISTPSEPFNLNLTNYGTVVKSHLERTICLNSTKEYDPLYLSVEISTCSESVVNYTLTTTLRQDFRIRLNKLTRAHMTPSSPAVYFFPPPPPLVYGRKHEFLFIQLTSNSERCMIMSVQNPTCPIFDTIETLQSHGRWQTVTTKTGLTIRTEDFPSGFYIVFLLLMEDSWCNHESFGQSEVLKPVDSVNTQDVRRKTINFMVRDEMPTIDYHFAIFIPLALFLTFISVIFSVHFHFHKLRCNLLPFETSSISTSHTQSPPFNISGRLGNPTVMGSTDSILRSRIQISELINSQPERLMVQSKRYYMAGILVASFYCVPVFQLILSYHRRLKDTGNFDLCYFNYLCSHMLGMFHDFNHIYSNIGYLICGPVFIGFVYLRQKTVEKISNGGSSGGATPFTSLVMVGFEKQQSNGNSNSNWIPRAPWDISKGAFIHHGLFYAMGFSLFMIGIMSSSYHICPNQNNFQFDTAFMYTIAALGIVTIYQFRHPLYVSASMTFLLLAIIAASTVIGLLWDSTKFRFVFSIFHMVLLLIILVYIHYVGYIRVNGVTVTEWRRMLRILQKKWAEDIKNFHLIGFQKDVWSPKGDPGVVVIPGPCRLVFPILVVAVNFGALTLIWTMLTGNFASQVLALYVINCSVYSIYYSVMKFVHYECRRKLWIQSALYLIMALFLWTWSLSYFGDVVTLWERSPAESRARNAECTFLGFYDSHDMFHFISAAALFSSLMYLLTVDDDLLDVPKSEIPVF